MEEFNRSEEKNIVWQGQSKGTPLGYRIFVWTLHYLGINAGYFILIFVAFWYWLFARKAIRSSRFYYREIHKMGFWEIKKNIYKGFYKLGQTLLDKVVIMGGVKNKFTFDFDGEHLLRDMAKAGEGGVLLSAHIGNWEIAGQLLRRIKVPVHIVMFDNEYQQIKNVMNDATEGKNFNTILIKDDFSHLIEMYKALKRKEFLCIHGDRFIERNKDKTILMDFLGKPARFPIGPFELISRFKIPYLFVYGVKATNQHYQFYAFDGQNRGNQAQFIMREFVDSLEKIVKKYPTQWFNFYDFWEK